MQGTRVRALVWEDPTCRRATRPVSHNYWLSLRVWSLCPATREAAIVRDPCTTMKSGPRLPQQEKALTQKRRPDTAKKKKKKKTTTHIKFRSLTASLRPQRCFRLLVLAPTLMQGLEPVPQSAGHLPELQVTAGWKQRGTTQSLKSHWASCQCLFSNYSNT